MRTRLSLVIPLIAAAGFPAVAFRNGHHPPANATEAGVGHGTLRDRARQSPYQTARGTLPIRRDVAVSSDAARETGNLLELIRELISTDAPKAFAIAAELPPDPERDDVLIWSIREWALADPLPAIERAGATADEPLRERLLAAAFVEWSQIDPIAAARAAALQLREGRLQDDAVVAIAQRWAQASPNDASAWIDEWASAELQNAARNSETCSPSSRSQGAE
jgi:hypothetical protein